jgi:hypothetical protein
LRTASDTTFAPVWYFNDTRQGHFYYHKKFITDFRKTVIPNGRIFNICLLSNKLIFTTTRGFYMTEQEQKLLQAQHRLEEAQARDRVKERKARTRMLIQKGAILEKAMPETSEMSMEDLENYLYALSLLQG